MIKHLRLSLAIVFGFSALSLIAQPGPPAGPSFSGCMAKIFGENSAFNANMEMQTKDKSGNTIIMPGKIASLDGKSRFEMDMAQMKSSQIPPEAVAQMKQMGMDKMIIISRPDKKISFVAYPGLQAYTEMPIQDPNAAKPASDFKMDITEMGKETVDGQACVKNKIILTDKEGKKTEAIVWNATDLKKFPIKIETTEQGHAITLLFKDVKLSKPDAALFDAPTGFKKYDDMMSLMQQEMMKRMGGGMSIPAH